MIHMVLKIVIMCNPNSQRIGWCLRRRGKNPGCIDKLVADTCEDKVSKKCNQICNPCMTIHRRFHKHWKIHCGHMHLEIKKIVVKRTRLHFPILRYNDNKYSNSSNTGNNENGQNDKNIRIWIIKILRKPRNAGKKGLI